MATQRRFTLDVDLAMATAIFDRLEIAGRPIAIGRLDGGSTEVFRIDLADGLPSLVLKLYPDAPEWRPMKERRVSEWLSGALSTPVPTCLQLDLSRALLPLRYAILTMVPGAPVRTWMETEGVLDLYRQMGALLRQMHRLPMEAYGYIKGDGVERPFASNRDYMIYAFDSAFQRFRDAGGDLALAHRLQALALANLDLAESGGAVLAHDDLHQGNVLAERDEKGDLRLSGLVDFGNARSADPLFDLAKAIFCASHEDPRAGAPLLEGYGALEHPDPRGALWLYTLHHRVSMWAFLIQLGLAPDDPNGPGGLIRDLRATVTADRTT